MTSILSKSFRHLTLSINFELIKFPTYKHRRGSFLYRRDEALGYAVGDSVIHVLEEPNLLQFDAAKHIQSNDSVRED